MSMGKGEKKNYNHSLTLSSADNVSEDWQLHSLWWELGPSTSAVLVLPAISNPRWVSVSFSISGDFELDLSISA